MNMKPANKKIAGVKASMIGVTPVPAVKAAVVGSKTMPPKRSIPVATKAGGKKMKL